MDTAGHLEGAYYVSRTELLSWLNGLLSTDAYKRVDQCGSGVPYILLLPSIFTNTTSVVAKGKLNARTEYDSTTNFKLIQEAFNKNGVTKVIDVERMAKGNMQANLEFLQWFKRLCDIHGVTPETVVKPPTRSPQKGSSGATSAASRTEQLGSATRPKTPSIRANGTMSATGSTTIHPATSSGSYRKNSAGELSSSGSGSASRLPYHQRNVSEGLQEESPPMSGRVVTDDAATAAIDLERRFYYDKLRDIEILVSNELRVAQMSSSQLAAEVKRLMYSTHEPTSTPDLRLS